MLSSDEIDTIRCELDRMGTEYGVRIDFDFVKLLNCYRLQVRKDHVGCVQHFSYEQLAFTRDGPLGTIRRSIMRIFDDRIKAAM